MQKAQNEVVSVQIKDKLVSMTIVDKENQSGFSFNERLFIVVHGHYFGYVSKVKLTDKPQQIDIDSAKVKIPFKNYYASEAEDNILRIKFTYQVEQKLQPKEWVLRLNSLNLASLWKELLDYEAKNQIKKKGPEGSRQSTIKNDNRKSTTKHKSSRDDDGDIEEIPLKDVLDQPVKKQSIKEKPIEMTGSFDNSLFQGDSEEEDKKKMRKSSQKKSNMRGSSLSPPKEEKKSEPEIVINKVEEKPLLKNNNQTNVTPLDLEKVKENNRTDQKQPEESPMKKSRVSELNLPLIEQQPLQYTPNSASQSLRRTNQKSVNPLDYQRQLSFSKSSTKKESIRSEDKTKSLTPEEKDLALMSDLLARLSEKNEKFPFSQISYNHKQFENWLKPYKHRLSSSTLSNPQRLQKLMSAIVGTMQEKQERSRALLTNQTNWIYKQLTQQQNKVITQFNEYCKRLMKDLVFEMYSHEFVKFLKKKKENNMLTLEYCQSLIVKVPLIGLLENRKGEDMNILNIEAVKNVKTQFKSYQYLHHIIQNRGNLRVPLTCLCQYAGITALFRAKAVYYQNDKYPQLMKRDLTRLQDVSNLPLKQSLKNRIKPLNQYHYNEMRAGQTSIDFKYHFVDEIDNVLAYDLYQNPSNNKVLRIELIQQYINNETLPFLTLESMKFDENSNTTKYLSSLSSKIKEKIERIVFSINNIDFIYIHPKQLSKIMHSQGINMRYLGTVYQKTSDQFMKSCLLSELMARIVRNFRNKTFQDICLEQTKVYKDPQELGESLREKNTDFFNCLLGNNLESQRLWKLLYADAENYYNVKVQTYQSLNKGQLLISLAYHCSLNFNWKEFKAGDIFKTQQFFKERQIQLNEVKIKSYKPKKSINVQSLKQKLDEPATSDNYQWIVDVLNLKKQKLPQELTYHDLDDPLKLYLSNFIEPDQLDWSNNFSHLGIYQTDKPSITNFKLDLMMIRWYLRKGNKYKYLNKFNQITTKVSNLYGNNHLILSDLYQQFSRHHQMRGEVQDSISFMKSSLLNLSALGGDHNKLMADKYFSMFKLLRSVNKETQAYQYLKKAKKIIQNSHSKGASLYYKIKLELASKLVEQDKHSQALKELDHMNEFFEIYQKQEQSFEQERSKMYILLHQCYKKLNKKQEINGLTQKVSNKLKTFTNHVNYQEIFWIVVYETLKHLYPPNKQAMMTIIGKIPTKQGIKFYKKALTFLQRRQLQKSLFDLFYQYCQNSPQIVKMVMQKGILDNWQNLSEVYERKSLFDFVSLVEELVYLYGRDRLLTCVKT